MAGQFPISPAALQKLKNAGVAIYPVDVHASMLTVKDCTKSGVYDRATCPRRGDWRGRFLLPSRSRRSHRRGYAGRPV